MYVFIHQGPNSSCRPSTDAVNRFTQSSFRPRNTLKDTDDSQGASSRESNGHYQSSKRSPELSELFYNPPSPNKPPSSTPDSYIVPRTWQYLEDSDLQIGDSSSLFSVDFPSSFDFGSNKGKGANKDDPAASKFRDSSEIRRPPPFFPIPNANMVVERTPAKASQPLVSSDPDVQEIKGPDAPNTSKRRQPAPQAGPVFGQASPLQSPFNRSKAEASVFNQSKRRPEHHRDHKQPNYQAGKDDMRRMLDPFRRRAPAANVDSRFA
jgi:hypothetical protein